MNLTAKKLLLLATLLLLPALAVAEEPGPVDLFGHRDTVYADLARVNETTWTLTVSLVNDEWLQALSLPFEFHSGKVKVVADSAVYTGGRVDHWDFKGFRADTAIQCVTMGLLANMGPSEKHLQPDYGRLVTVFISSLNGEPIEKLGVDTTTTHPSNSLMMVAYKIQYTDPPDTIPADRAEDLTIYPAFVVRQSN